MALDATRAALFHFPEEALESYALGRLPDAELAAFEEHLLICEHCQQRLDAEDNFAELVGMLRGMEQAAELPAFPASSPIEGGGGPAGTTPSWSPRAGSMPITGEFARWTDRKLWHAPFWGIALAAFLTIGLGIATWILPLARSSAEESDIVNLKTLRGGSVDELAQARAKRTLALAIDLGESASSAIGPYRVEVVEANGNLAWTSRGVASDSGRIAARVEKRLAAGIYWVRVYASSGKLLREFGLRLD